MVHQLLLVGTIPHTSYVQTVSTLKAFTGLQSAQGISTYTLLTKPHNVYKPKFEPGKVNYVVQYYMKCITLWADDASRTLDISKPILKDSEEQVQVDRLFVGKEDNLKWTLQIADIPTAGKNQVCSAQNMYESTLVHHHTNVMAPGSGQTPEHVKPEDDVIAIDISNDNNGSASQRKMSDAGLANLNGNDGTIRNDSFLQFLEDLGYEVVNQYWIKGVRFFYGDIIIELFKVFVRDDTKNAGNKITLKLLDESNSFQVKAYKNISKSTEVDQINQGTKELVKLQEVLSGLIKLEIPDRMFMDSRITYT